MSEIKVLTSLELRSLYGINKFLHTRDKKEKNRYRLLICAWAMLIAMVFFYVGALVYGLSALGLSSIVPAYLVVIASLLILAFGIFKAGNAIFSQKGYDILASLPVKPHSIVVSRFLAMYVEDMILTLVILLPGVAVFGVCRHPGIGFYLAALLGALFIPAIPLVISTLIGTLIMALSSGVKHKSLVQTFLMIALVLAVLLGSFSMPEEFTPEQLATLATTVGDLLGSIYPPALWLGKGMLELDLGAFSRFILVSAAAAVLTLLVIARNFHAISRQLMTFSAKHTYKIGEMESRSMLKALYAREARRYFSSSIYVTNTIVGPIMGSILAGALCFLGMDTVKTAVPMDITPLLPFVIAAVQSMMTTTSVAISMEGKQFWLIRSLPIPAKTLLDSKLLLNLSLMLPFYLLAEVFLVIAVKPDFLGFIWLVLIPPVVMLFAVVLGLTVDLRFRRFDWEKKEAVVKQGASSMLGGLAGPFFSLVLGVATLLVPARFGDLARGAVCVLLLACTALLYRKNNRVKLETL